MKYKNEEHFNVSGDHTVEVVVRFDINEAAKNTTIVAAADDYLSYFLRGLYDGSTDHHKTWGRSIEIRRGV